MPETSRRERSSEAGFTLIELLVVIAIILIVASFALPAYNRILTRSHEAVLRDDLFTMRQMINRYTLDNHQPPERAPRAEQTTVVAALLCQPSITIPAPSRASRFVIDCAPQPWLPAGPGPHG
jgi:prepilin-type N-terminal cleavage/methylation domain-containing protein